jgi:SAM-dependent methyltransferase
VHRNNLRQFERHGRAHVLPGARVLEVGPDAAPSTLRRLVAADVTWETLDLAPRPGVALTHQARDPYRYPLDDDAYDVVLSANVVEHVPRVWTWMRELARVCRPGGVVITLGPVSWPYHESPVDCWRIYPAGMRALCEDAGLEVVVSEWGSVELEWLDRRMPGRLRAKRAWQRLSGVFLLWHALTGLPPEGAYDTITVARKPAAAC